MPAATDPVPGALSVPRIDGTGITKEVFAKEYIVANRPVILTKIVEQWSAYQKWSFEHFKCRMGDKMVGVGVSGKKEERNLGEYIDSLDSLEKEHGTQPNLTTPYLSGWCFEDTDSTLAEDFFVPEIFEDYLEKLTRQKRAMLNLDRHWIFCGPAGSTTSLHVDPCFSHAWLAQISGRKKFIMYPPCSHDYVMDKGGFADLTNVDQSRFPNLGDAERYEVIVEPGEILFIPGNWAHFVTCVTRCISLTYNFCDKSNFAALRMSFLINKIGSAMKANEQQHMALRAQAGSDSDDSDD